MKVQDLVLREQHRDILEAKFDQILLRLEQKGQ
jgi:hypothetical protein